MNTYIICCICYKSFFKKENFLLPKYLWTHVPKLASNFWPSFYLPNMMCWDSWLKTPLLVYVFLGVKPRASCPIGQYSTKYISSFHSLLILQHMYVNVYLSIYIYIHTCIIYISRVMLWFYIFTVAFIYQEENTDKIWNCTQREWMGSSKDPHISGFLLTMRQ